jgi:hypothetical protein
LAVLGQRAQAGELFGEGLGHTVAPFAHSVVDPVLELRLM